MKGEIPLRPLNVESSLMLLLMKITLLVVLVLLVLIILVWTVQCFFVKMSRKRDSVNRNGTKDANNLKY